MTAVTTSRLPSAADALDARFGTPGRRLAPSPPGLPRAGGRLVVAADRPDGLMVCQKVMRTLSASRSCMAR